MRKIDLVNIISDKTGIPKIDVLVTIESLVTEIKENMLKGENIYIRGFGSFINKKKAAKIGRNIRTNTAIQIPAHYVPAFKPSPEFTAEIKQTVKPKEE
ncbi:MAG: integration host factor subunit beta [Bacteroidetes bacterium]|nr:integration host factor subunit beta [Bacteroidota bacterium]MBS1648349.1 integration host factor subunit beta [Bacteroidota bacterium]